MILCILGVGGIEISEDDPKTAEDYLLHPMPKLKITRDRRPEMDIFSRKQATLSVGQSVGPSVHPFF